MIPNSEITVVKTKDTCSFPIDLGKKYHGISALNYTKTYPRAWLVGHLFSFVGFCQFACL